MCVRVYETGHEEHSNEDDGYDGDPNIGQQVTDSQHSLVMSSGHCNLENNYQHHVWFTLQLWIISGNITSHYYL